MSRQPRPGGHAPRDAVGDAALTCGVVAVVFVAVPVIGDLLAVPAALAAMVLGTIGVVREDRGLAAASWRSLVGGLLGLVAAFATFMVFVAGGSIL